MAISITDVVEAQAKLYQLVPSYYADNAAVNTLLNTLIDSANNASLSDDQAVAFVEKNAFEDAVIKLEDVLAGGVTLKEGDSSFSRSSSKTHPTLARWAAHHQNACTRYELAMGYASDIAIQEWAVSES